MRVIRFSTEEIAPQDRFACWQERGNKSLLPTLLTSDESSGFLGRAQRLALDGLYISALTHPSVRINRSAKLVRRSDPEVYHVNLVLTGEAALRQAGRETVFGAGQFALFDSSRPFEARRSGGSGAASGLIVEVPRRMLPIATDRADQLTAISFSTRAGLGGLFARWVIDVLRRADEFEPQDAPGLASVTADLLAAVLSPRLEAALPETAESQRRLLRLQISDYIQQHLGDPNLCPGVIAAVHQISVRRLHELFTDQEMTVAAWIRHQRLESCRRDLADPRFRPYPVRAIAERWGFRDGAHFNRAFRAAYGMPPGHYRRKALDDR
ncbi:helix-turn-helix domain-containing protein [Actinomadura decatromicini]|uniref:Helix-turn-helix domain-containing protein n=1 Tax=Actinomadura decatromicini TaxID=2604572 RepID=A0A5D3F7V6_9ACTN|nr:helix-turn-helix domain-containing protein [Actinomadura decatromicini]TYK44381.1 helix-turn-helix domain-containing protein [Actinomadura decatromicini]